MTYTPYYATWHDFPNRTTPITAAAMQHIETGITNAGGGSGSLIVTDPIHVSAAEVLALNTSPKEIVAAPGSGKVIYPTGGYCSFTFGGTPYSVPFAGQPNFQLTTALGAVSGFASLLEIAGAQPLLTGSDDKIASWSPNAKSDISSGFDNWTIAMWEDAPLVFFYQDSGDPTLGNGTFDLVVSYLILDLP